MGAPTIGGDTTGAVTENTGAIVTGDLDDVGLLSGNNDDTWSISGPATYGTASIDPATGAWSYDLDDSHPAVQALDPGDTLIDTFTVFMADAGGGSDTQDVTITINGAVCFTAGTMIETDRGARPVETLGPGALVQTRDAGYQPLVWAGGEEIGPDALAANGRLRPVRIAAGALGHGMPRTDLCISRQHRVLISGAWVYRAFGRQEVLIAAAKMIGLPGIALDTGARSVRYIHLALDRHHVLNANGAPCESLLAGPQALAMLPPKARVELIEALPEITEPGHSPDPARMIARNGTQIRRYHKLVKRQAARDGRAAVA